VAKLIGSKETDLSNRRINGRIKDFLTDEILLMES